MKTELVRYSDLGADMIAQLTAIRNADARYDSPFFDLEFARQVSLVRGDTRIAVLYEEGDLVGYWAMHVRPGKWARPIGSVFSDWHGPVLAAGFDEIDAAQWLSQLGLKGMTISGLQSGSGVASDAKMMGVGQASLGGGSAQAYLANQREMFPKYAKNIRRAERLIAKEFGGQTFTADDRSKEAFSWVLERKSAQYAATGLHDVLAPDWVRDLMGNLFECRTDRFAGRLSTLRFGETLVAAEFDLVSDTIVHGWITVFDQDYARYSPGHLLIRDIICDMENTGHLVNDMGAGEASYKKYYETYVLPAVTGTVRCKATRRPLAGCWRMGEEILPDRLSTTMASVRRRTDQIAGADLGLAARLSGFAKALNRPKRHK